MAVHKGFRFVANLKPYTLRRGAGNRRFGSYLLSVDYARDLIDLAREALAGDAALCADNGNVDLIRSLIAGHTTAAIQLEADRRALSTSLRRSLRPGDIPPGLRDRHRTFSENVRNAARSAVDETHITEVVRAQNAMNPTYLVGMEDFTIATLTAHRVEPNFADLDRRFIEGLAKRAVAFAVDTASGRYGAVKATVFAGLHAANYDSARIAGKVAGAAGVRGIATGLVGALQDKSYVDYVVEDGVLIDIGSNVPRPYLRVAEIAAGMHVGFVEACQRRPAFHALGAGSPILLPLLAALGDEQTYTSTDSTAPIVDGWSGPTTSLYVDDPAPLKLKAFRILEEWLVNDREWNCPCPYCQGLNRAFSPRIDEARRWWLGQNKPKLTAESLRAPSPLPDWLPLLGNASDPGLRLAGAIARVSHNHWVLQRIETAARRHSQSHEQLVAWVDGVVQAYIGSSADPRWKLATQIAWQIIRRASEATRSATPTTLSSPS